jgi:hypothetical protein
VLFQKAVGLVTSGKAEHPAHLFGGQFAGPSAFESQSFEGGTTQRFRIDGELTGDILRNFEGDLHDQLSFSLSGNQPPQSWIS